MWLCPDQNKRFFPNMAWSEIHWSETVKCINLRNGFVCGFFFNTFTILCNASMSMSLSLTRNVNERHPSGSVVVLVVVIIEKSQKGVFLCECQFRFSEHTNTLFWWCSKGMRLDKSIIRDPLIRPLPVLSPIPSQLFSTSSPLRYVASRLKMCCLFLLSLEEKINKEYKICWRR